MTRTAMVGRPPTREDLIMALCPPGTMSNAAQARCEHELVPLYRACGLDITNPRTAHCRVLWRNVRRAAS
jgi:hypothetical protein